MRVARRKVFTVRVDRDSVLPDFYLISTLVAPMCQISSLSSHQIPLTAAYPRQTRDSYPPKMNQARCARPSSPVLTALAYNLRNHLRVIVAPNEGWQDHGRNRPLDGLITPVAIAAIKRGSLCTLKARKRLGARISAIAIYRRRSGGADALCSSSLRTDWSRMPSPADHRTFHRTGHKWLLASSAAGCRANVTGNTPPQIAIGARSRFSNPDFIFVFDKG